MRSRRCSTARATGIAAKRVQAEIAAMPALPDVVTAIEALL